jgi:AraC-like DNA-binding protein
MNAARDKTTPSEVIRSEWLSGVIRDCQVFLGLAGNLDRVHVAEETSALVMRLPVPVSLQETLILRGLLLDLAIQWGEVDHTLYHRKTGKRYCRFLPSRVLYGYWSQRTVSSQDAFARWAREYVREFNVAHPTASVDAIKQYLDENFDRPLRISDLARMHGCSGATLTRRFRKATGYTIHAYQLQVRAARATGLLRATPHSVDAIARQIGYASKKDLYRLLRRVGQTAPSTFRKK